MKCSPDQIHSTVEVNTLKPILSTILLQSLTKHLLFIRVFSIAVTKWDDGISKPCNKAVDVCGLHCMTVCKWVAYLK